MLALLDAIPLVRTDLQQTHTKSILSGVLALLEPPAPQPALSLLSFLRSLVMHRRALPATAASREECGGGGGGGSRSGRGGECERVSVRGRIACLQVEVMLDSRSRRSKALLLSLTAYLAHRSAPLAEPPPPHTGAAAAAAAAVRGAATYIAETDVGIEGLDLSFNGTGCAMPPTRGMTRNMLRCRHVLLRSTETLEEGCLTLSLGGVGEGAGEGEGGHGEGDGDGDGGDKCVRVRLGSQEILAITEAALVVYALVSKRRYSIYLRYWYKSTKY